MGISLSQNKGMAARTKARLRRQARGRKKIFGSGDRPRLVVTRSARHIVAQVIDDTQGVTLASASTMEADLRSSTGDKSDKAKQVGALVAERAKQAGVANVVFDRAGNQYHGRIAALADGAREAGLGF
ncbi:50S ribosomal protein L18 [Propioniciclava soli]|uniref:Large ribosomal subunit protein uL18 n=1 Tax=Propioniciclava soli TaxID=2775081 RepID=A0ABZ3CA85_9ACTN|nr:50S ribosomal protein L18 [Propioniciclava soli]